VLVADAGCGDDDPSLDPGVGQVLVPVVVGVEDLHPEQQRHGAATERVPGHRDPLPVQPPAQAGDRRLDLLEVVEDGVHVRGPVAPEDRCVGEVGVAETERGGVQVRGLDDGVPVGGPEVGERPVPVKGGEEVRGPVPVGEQDDGQVVAADRDRDLQLEVRGAAGDLQDHRAVGDHCRGIVDRDGACFGEWCAHRM